MSNNKPFLQSKFHDWARDITSLANPLVLIFVPLMALGFSKAYYVLLIALVVNEIVGSVIKIVFPKTRPNGQTYSNLIEKIDAGSFPSLHSSRIALVYLTLFYFSDLLALKIIFICIIPIVMFSRINLKKHFLTDIIGGLIIGSIIWYITTLYSL